MNLWLLLPVKPLIEAKSRLASALSPQARAAFSRALMQHVLSTAIRSGVLAGAVVISRDPEILELATQTGVHPLPEKRNKNIDGLNAALSQGRKFALKRGAQAVLVLPADLPLLTIEDLHTLQQLSLDNPGVVIAPSIDGGTNALLLRPPQAIDFAFGEQSFARHQQLAQALNLPCTIYRSPTIEQDVDEPAHMATLRSILSQPYNSSPQA